MLLITFALWADEIHWQEDYATAVVSAKTTKKPIYVLISAAECPWCAKFEKTTLKDKKVIELLNKNFIAVHLVRDFDTIPQKFKQRPVPRHYFVSSKGNMLSEDIGYVEADVFADELQTILKERTK
jgi:thioredoxin-related protein